MMPPLLVGDGDSVVVGVAVEVILTDGTGVVVLVLIAIV